MSLEASHRDDPAGGWVSRKIRQISASIGAVLLKRLKIGGKLTVGFSILVALTLLVAGLNYLGSLQAISNISRTSNLRAPSALASAQAQANLLRMLGAVRGYLAVGEETYRVDYDTASGAFSGNLAELETLMRSVDGVASQTKTPGYGRDLDELKTELVEWQDLPGQLFDLRDDQLRREPALKILIVDATPVIAKIVINLKAVTDSQERREPTPANMVLLADMGSFQSSFYAMVAGLRGYITTARDTFKFEYQSNMTINQTAWANLIAKKTLLDAGQQAKLAKVAKDLETFLKLPDRMFEVVESEHVREDLFLFRTKAVPLAERMLQSLDRIATNEQALLQSELSDGRQQLLTIQQAILFGGAFAVALGLALGYVFRENIAGPVGRLTRVAERIRNGDLKARAEIESGDEIGHLAEAFNKMTGQLNTTLSETERLLKVTEDRAVELGAIGKVSQALIAESELDSTIQLIGNQMKEIFDADIVYVALIDPKTNLIHFPFQVGENFSTMSLGEGLTSTIIQTGEPLLFNKDVREHSVEIGAIPVGIDVLSYLGVPIKTSQGTIGVISVQSTTKEGLFSEDSLRLLTTIAANAGAALHNAQLFSEALENLRQVEILTNAAAAIEQRSFEPEMVETVAARTDALGELARVFRNMAVEVRVREQRLRRQLQQMQLDVEEKQQAKAETLAVFIPMDRRQAMSRGIVLPEHAHGTALFADVSGFTALTEQLAKDLGLERGAEEIIRHLNRVFTVLIDDVHRYGGSVTGFSGDAVTCWFDASNLAGEPRPAGSTERAVAAADAMLKGMGQFAAIATPSGATIGLAIKIAAATGAARRFVVGAASGHEIDVLAGATLDLLARAEHAAERGEIVLAATGVPDLSAFAISGWREDRTFAVIGGLARAVEPEPWPELEAGVITEVMAQPWLLPEVFEKVRSSHSDQLSELREVTALFVRFGGIDFDSDKAASDFDRFIGWVERTIAPFNGSIIQVTVGDKGSYLYVVFGAPVARDDDTYQAVAAALTLSNLPADLDYIRKLDMGLATGHMRVGAYGGASSRTYGALGDKANLAARLMMAAGRSPDRASVLCDESVFQVARTEFDFETMPPMFVKGKAEPVAFYRPTRKRGGSAETNVLSPSVQSTLPIDQLSALEQMTLKVASVIGEQFPIDVLAAVYPSQVERADLEAHLASLCERGLLVATAREPSTYAFKDEAVHRTAYSLMLFAQRRQLHRAIAELLERGDASGPRYAEVAHHWQAADDIQKAVTYLERAGDEARDRGDLEGARRYFSASLALNP